MPDNLIAIIESLLLSSDKPLSVDRIANILDGYEGVDKTHIRSALTSLQTQYQQHSFDLVEVASGYRLQVSQDYAHWVAKLWEEKPPKYSRALLETLAIIAYQQPVTRGEVEAIRGVSVSSNIVRTLLERGWIRSVGHKEVPGRPEIFATTKEFLDYFNLQKINQLPPLEELQDWQEDYAAQAPQSDHEKAASNEVSGQDDLVQDNLVQDNQTQDNTEQDNLSQDNLSQDNLSQDKTEPDSLNKLAEEFHSMQDEGEDGVYEGPYEGPLH